MVYRIIYVPGLADRLNRNVILQGGALKLWRLSRNVQTHYFSANWADTHESFARKIERLIALIDSYYMEGQHVALMTASAGSGLTFAAYAQRKEAVSAVVSICGKLHHPETIPKELYAINPAFKEAATIFDKLDDILTKKDRDKFLVVRAVRDGYVPPEDGRIIGAHEYRIFSAGHVLSIMAALSLYRQPLIRFIKSKP